MNRRAELEIVINTRWVERGFWLLIIVAITGFMLWQSTNVKYEGAAEDLARIAELETTLAQKDDDLATLRVQVGLLEARIDDLRTLAQQEKNATPAPILPPEPSVPKVFNTAWTYAGMFTSGEQYRLNDVTIFVTSTYPNPVPLRYELCWSSIDCENVITRGSFTAAANDDTTYEVTITLPRFVDASTTQRLQLTIYNGTNVLLAEERIVR